MIFTVMVTLWIVAVTVAHFLTFVRQEKPFVKGLADFTVAGHRGASGNYPGNTIQAFRATLEIDSASLLEMDLWQSRDGYAMVIHDGTVDAITENKGEVSSFTLEELQGMDAGYRWTPGGIKYPFRGQGYRVPSLAEVLESFPQTRMSLDIKANDTDFARRVLDQVQRSGAGDYVVVGSFHSEIHEIIRSEYPDIATSFSEKEFKKFFIMYKIGLAGFYRPKDDVMMIPEFSDGDQPEYLGEDASQGFRVLTEGLVREAHRKKIPVFAWTINRRENMERLHSWGIDGIVTDYPDILKEVIESGGSVKKPQ